MKSTICVLAVVLGSVFARSVAETRGTELLDVADVHGGLVVHAGCRDGKLTTALRPDDSYVVHGLTSPSNLGTARATVRAAGEYGGVSIAAWDGSALPYVDGLANLVVVDDAPDLTQDEVLRVVAPGGVALLSAASTIDGEDVQIDGKAWRMLRKDRPSQMDEWTHFLHNPSNNAVSSDSIVAPPRRVQWEAGPRYSRHHDKMSSVSAVVTSGGRVFTIIDEGPLWSILMPPKWTLTARDAYNGKLLWKRPIAQWHPHLFGLKSGPASLPRRLVSQGDKVYVTLGLHSAVVQLDARTGKTIQQYERTEGTTEILLDGNTLHLVAGPLPEKGAWFAEAQRKLMALAADTGKVIWEQEAWVVPGTLSVLDDRLYFFDKDEVACLSAATGETKWRSAKIPRPARYPSCYNPTLVATEKVILISGGEAAGQSTFGRWSTKGATDTISGLDAATGKTLWSAHHGDSGYRSAEDVFVINDKVWFSDSRDGAKPGNTYGLDLMTGELKSKFPPDRDIYFFHHRCYRGKATEKYLITSRVGIEYIDVENQHWEMNHWVRGACLYGVLPANGLTYAPQHPCACYLESKLDGFNALAAADGQPRIPDVLPQRLEKGPAYGTKIGAIAESGEWLTFRHDNQRSGTTSTETPVDLKQSFAVEIGGKLSSPVVGSGLVIVAAIDRHSVHAMSAADGKPAWTFVADGRIDSPPTIHGQLVLFGSKDGYLYCLRASDGQLVWRLRAAPVDERVLVYEQLESVWPLHGSVLIRENIAYAACGRSNFLDGGVRMLRVDVESGEIVSENVSDGHQKIEGKDHQDYVTWLNMPAARTDILSTANDLIYMRSQAFNYDGTRLPLKAKAWNGQADMGAPPPDQDTDHSHLFAATGFLDDTGWHRTYWIYGSDFYSGWAGYPTAGKVTPAGKILTTDDEMVYGFGRLPQFWRWTTPLEFHVFAAPKSAVGQMGNRAKAARRQTSQKSHGYAWVQRYPILVRAMVKTGDTIFLAGPRDVVDETAMRPDSPVREQVAAWQGKDGAVMMAISAADGSKQATYDLSAVPRFDGLIAAGGNLYITTTDGKLVRWGKQ
jgi:outer membrane protein assembly factor BamB